MIAGAFGAICNLLFPTSIISVVIPLSVSVMLGVIYYFIRFKKIIEPFVFPFSIISIVAISILWVVNGGISGSNFMPGFVVLILATISVPEKKKKYIIILYLVLFLFVYSIQFFRPDLIINYTSESDRLFDSVVTFTYCSCFIYLIMRFVHKNYTLERLKLRESKAKYQLLTENASDAIWVLNITTMKFTYVSPAIYQLGGFTVEEALKQDVKEMLSPQSAISIETAIRTHCHDFIQNPRLENHYIDVVQQKCKDGSYIWVELSAKYRYNLHGDVEIVGVSRNISERKMMEDKLRQSEAQLLELNATKDKFFSIIAHDLRSPFNGFLGLTQIMAENSQNLKMAEVQNISVRMRDSAINLFRLLENLLDWALMQQSLIPFEPKVLELRPIVAESIWMTMEYAKNKDIEISYTIPDNLAVFADRNMLQTVIRNLVSNALKFTPKEGNVSISAKDSGDRNIEVSVSDTGIGMSQKIIDNLFRIDVRANRKGTDGEYSSGLGLLLCHEFIGKHDGKIWVESEEGKGSVFYFTIPQKS
jgi:PAS domain S-box-containing protein